MTTIQTDPITQAAHDDAEYRRFQALLARGSNIVPLRDHILVERDALTDRTPSGLWLPLGRKEKVLRGTVKAVGPGRICQDGQRSVMQINVGDRCLFSHYAGHQDTNHRLGEREFLLREDDVLAVLEPPCPRPINQRVLVEFDRFAEPLLGGLITKTETDERLRIGIVVDVGPGFPNLERPGFAPQLVETGDEVVYEWWNGYELKLRTRDEEFGCLESGTYRLIRAEELLGILG